MAFSLRHLPSTLIKGERLLFLTENVILPLHCCQRLRELETTIPKQKNRKTNRYKEKGMANFLLIKASTTEF